jgi:nicotinamidase-related amidase
MEGTALIIVDVQNCFVTENTRHILKGIKEAIPRYSEVIFTRFVNHDETNFAVHGYHKCKSEVENAIHPKLSGIAKEHLVFTKHTFSAFKAMRPKKTGASSQWNSDSIETDSIVEYLKEKGVEEVHLCGTDTEACVLASAYEAFDLGFRVRVLYELCASCNGEEYHEAGKKLLQKNMPIATLANPL